MTVNYVSSPKEIIEHVIICAVTSFFGLGTIKIIVTKPLLPGSRPTCVASLDFDLQPESCLHLKSMADPKYANLPGIAVDEPDVYETTDLPEDDQAGFESEELSSESVDRIVVSPNAAFDKFKDKQISSKKTDFSDRITRTCRTGYEAEEYEMLGEGNATEETPQQCFQRLHHEIQELSEKMQRAQELAQENDESKRLRSTDLAQQVLTLKQHLSSLQHERLLGPDARVDLVDPQGAIAKRLLTHLDSIKTADPAKEGEKQAPSSDGDKVAYELYFNPQEAKFRELSTVSELEKRLSKLEAAVGKSSSNASSAGMLMQGTSVLATLELMQSHVSTLDPMTLDHIEGRLQGVLGKLSEATKHKSYAEGTDAHQKVNRLYEVVEQWGAMADTLPQVVERLRGLKELHEHALQFSQLLNHLESSQNAISNSLQNNSTLLTGLQSTMKENAIAIEANFTSLQSRMKNLSV
uniref:Dynactin 2 (p50) n=1 Tax=Eptatretus burgeri TaxID=7764 RepID=A0A8C4QQ29_EPTBU